MDKRETKAQTTLDSAGHLTLAVSDFLVSERFYSKLFAKIGLERIANKEKSAAWKTREGFGIWIKQATVSSKYVFHAPGIHHLCIKAQSKEAVDELYNFLLKEKVKVANQPKNYPEFLPTYYALYFEDPDGIKLEFAFY
ncbi:MAG: VOC family protein [Candidatus Micrarchaeota archaeon]